jgi:hypothetical protein
MIAVRYTPTGKFFQVQPLRSNTNLVASGDLKTNNNSLLIFPDIWAATLFIEKQPTLKNQAIELVEIEMREVRVVPPVIEVVEIKTDETCQSDRTDNRLPASASQNDGSGS